VVHDNCIALMLNKGPVVAPEVCKTYVMLVATIVVEERPQYYVVNTVLEYLVMAITDTI